MEPNPRTVSRELLTRTEFMPAEIAEPVRRILDPVHDQDWFSHGHGDPAHTYELPLEQGDPWPAPPLTVLRTLPDTTRPPGRDLPADVS